MKMEKKHSLRSPLIKHENQIVSMVMCLMFIYAWEFIETLQKPVLAVI
uniref:Uncharacterized protein n=1 Tax=Arundo donax TaxID=35708 RepID=A0A0A8Y1F1_ARUDO